MKKLFFLFVALTVLTACGNETIPEQEVSKQETAEEMLLPLEVEILTDADAFEPGEEGQIEIKVTKGDENVSDADEVLLEIWKQGHEHESASFDAENVGEGKYILPHTFEEDGLYYVIAHVTARGSHIMPKKEFKVGQVEVDKPEEQHAQHEHQGNSEHHEHQDHGHSTGTGLTIHLMQPDVLEANQEAQWMVHLAMEDGSPLTEAKVRFDYWQDGGEHTIIDATESSDGEYTAEFAFTESGEFRVVVHINKDELHEHQETKVQVD